MRTYLYVNRLHVLETTCPGHLNDFPSNAISPTCPALQGAQGSPQCHLQGLVLMINGPCSWGQTVAQPLVPVCSCCFLGLALAWQFYIPWSFLCLEAEWKGEGNIASIEPSCLIPRDKNCQGLSFPTPLHCPSLPQLGPQITTHAGLPRGALFPHSLTPGKFTEGDCLWY